MMHIIRSLPLPMFILVVQRRRRICSLLETSLWGQKRWHSVTLSPLQSMFRLIKIRRYSSLFIILTRRLSEASLWRLEVTGEDRAYLVLTLALATLTSFHCARETLKTSTSQIRWRMFLADFPQTRECPPRRVSAVMKMKSRKMTTQNLRSKLNSKTRSVRAQLPIKKLTGMTKRVKKATMMKRMMQAIKTKKRKRIVGTTRHKSKKTMMGAQLPFSVRI